jgi:hypothetical protein
VAGKRGDGSEPPARVLEYEHPTTRGRVPFVARPATEEPVDLWRECASDAANTVKERGATVWIDGAALCVRVTSTDGKVAAIPVDEQKITQRPGQVP